MLKSTLVTDLLISVSMDRVPVGAAMGKFRFLGPLLADLTRDVVMLTWASLLHVLNMIKDLDLIRVIHDFN